MFYRLILKTHFIQVYNQIFKKYIIDEGELVVYS